MPQEFDAWPGLFPTQRLQKASKYGRTSYALDAQGHWVEIEPSGGQKVDAFIIMHRTTEPRQYYSQCRATVMSSKVRPRYCGAGGPPHFKSQKVTEQNTTEEEMNVRVE